MKNQYNDRWSYGSYTGATVDETIQLNSEALGRVTIIQDLIDLEYEDIIGVLSEAKDRD